MGSLSPSQLPLRNASPVMISFFSLSLCSFTQLSQEFLALFWRFNFFCQHSVDVLCKSFYMQIFFVFVFVFFDVFVGKGERVLLLFCHPASSPLVFYITDHPLHCLSLVFGRRWGVKVSSCPPFSVTFIVFLFLIDLFMFLLLRSLYIEKCRQYF